MRRMRAVLVVVALAVPGGVALSGPSSGQANCHPSYPGQCIPAPPPSLNCADVPFSRFPALPPDPHGFDGNDNDQIGCESSDKPPFVATTTTTVATTTTAVTVATTTTVPAAAGDNRIIPAPTTTTTAPVTPATPVRSPVALTG